MTSTNTAILGFYDYGEVARSVLIAIAASYVALDLAGRVARARGLSRLAWLAGGATAMGIGIWEMHFKGMVAFHLPIPVAYHWPTALAALLVAILASAIALFAASRQKIGWGEAAMGSIVMGSGIAALHYTLMDAMRLPAITRYSPLLVTLSVFLAILFSLIALLMAFGLREETKWTVRRRLGSAVVMGGAISAMHYTGMAAVSFFSSSPPDLDRTVGITPLGSSGVAVVTLIVLLAAVITSSVDRQADAKVQRLNQDLERRVVERTSELAGVNEELEKAFDEIKKFQDQLRLVINTIPAMVWCALPDGSLDFANQRWLEYFGYSFDQIRGCHWTEKIHPEDRDDTIAKWRAALASGDSFELEVRLQRADGKYRRFLTRAVPLRAASGNIVKWYGTKTDIEDRRRTEKALRELQAELARVTPIAAMGELTASIAHEINQPLGAVVTNGNAALRWLAGSPPNMEEVRQAIQRTVGEANRASDVIGRIRALLQKTALRTETLDVNIVIQEVLGLAESELQRAGVTVQMELAPDVPAVLGDRIQLQQVMFNLILNSIDAMSTVTERPRQLLIKSEKYSDGVLIEVHDTGKGIDPEQASRIFDSFFTTKQSGIGMGLTVSRSIVEAHVGRLWFTPRSPHGAVFHFTVPKAA
jgi:PAS domain S-box-containing protein